MSVLDVFSLLGTMLLLGLLLRLFAVYIVARIRLTDIIGYVTAVAGLLTLVVYDWERFGWAAVIGWAGGAMFAIVWTWVSVRARKHDPDHELLGVFLVGEAPHAVRNWVAMPARRA